MRYRVIKEYGDAPENPISISKGEDLDVLDESNPQGDWPNWILCSTGEREGWIPRQIVEIRGEKALVLEDYTAREHNLKTGDILFSEKELNGWIWGWKETEPGQWGWAPLNHLETVPFLKIQ